MAHNFNQELKDNIITALPEFAGAIERGEIYPEKLNISILPREISIDESATGSYRRFLEPDRFSFEVIHQRKWK